MLILPTNFTESEWAETQDRLRRMEAEVAALPERDGRKRVVEEVERRRVRSVCPVVMEFEI